MTMNEIGLRDARKELGPLANRAHLAGEITYLTRNGERIAAIVPLDRILKETPMVTEIIATVPKTASRATAAESWRTMATDRGLHVEIVGKTTDGTPVIEYNAEQYALVQDETDVWPVPLRCSTCSTEPGSVPGETFRFDRIHPETDEAEFMCGTCWDRYGPEN